MKLRDLFTNPDGTLSRTQITIWIALVLTVALTLAHVFGGREVLSWPVLVVLAGLHVFALVDRMQARYIAFRIGRDGAGFTIGQEAERSEEHEFDDEPQRRRYHP